MTPVDVLRALRDEKKILWANWFIVRVLTRPQYLAYAIYAAEQVIDLYEQRYPKDDRPRRAIEAAKAVLANDTPSNRKAAWVASEAASAVGLAASAVGLAASAVGLAAEAACGAAEAACGAARAAVWAARAAGWAAEAAGLAAKAAGAAEAACGAGRAASAAEAAGLAAVEAMQTKILTYGLSLLEGKIDATP
jgi:hypothetical protein